MGADWLGAGLAGAGVALACSEPALAWLALVPLLRALDGASVRRAALAGALCGVAAGLTLGAWLPRVLVEAFGLRAPAALAVWALAALGVAPAAMGFALVVSRSSVHRPAYAPAVGALWGATELALAHVCPGLPWLALGTAQIETGLAPVAGVFGLHAVSAWVAGASAVLAQATRRVAPRSLAAGSVGLLAVAGIGAGCGARGLEPAREGARPLRVAIVQPGLPMRERSRPDFAPANLERLLALTGGAAPAALVVWPEAAFPFALHAHAHALLRVQRLAERRGAAIVAGGYRRAAAGGLHTSAFLFAPGRGARAIHDKRRLLPLAEAVPAWLPASLRRPLGRLLPARPLRPGRAEPELLELAGGRVRASVLICFEAAFSGEAVPPGAELLLHLVNDGWYDSTPAGEHHLRLARWRAVEAGAHLVRATATGVSAFVAPDGTLAQRLEVGAAGARVTALPLRVRVTPFERWGHAPLLAAAALAAAFALRRAPRPDTAKRRAGLSFLPQPARARRPAPRPPPGGAGRAGPPGSGTGSARSGA